MIMYNEETYIKDIQKRTKTLSKLFSKWFKIENIDRLSAKSRLPPRYITFLKEAWEALESVYPGRGDIQFNLVPEFKTHTNSYGSNHVKNFQVFSKFVIKYIYIVVRFPELTIKNSRRGSLDLKDLFIRIPIRVASRGISFDSIQGTRMTISLSEYSSGYAHSHLSSVDYKTFLYKDADDDISLSDYDNFCLGQGDINSVLALLNASYDVDNFKLLLFQLETYASWESLEGVPHIRLSGAVEKSYAYPKLKLSTCDEAYRTIRDRVTSGRATPPNLNWKVRDGMYEIIDDEAFEEFFRQALLGTTYEGRWFVYKDEKGEYFTSSSSVPREVVGVHNQHWIPFRGQKVPFTITGNVRTVDENTKKFINPRIKNYVRARLEQTANSTKIREIGATRANTYDNPR